MMLPKVKALEWMLCVIFYAEPIQFMSTIFTNNCALGSKESSSSSWPLLSLTPMLGQVVFFLVALGELVWLTVE